MLRWKSSALALIALIQTGAAQTASQRPSLDVRRVGHRIACQCGCVDTVATCAMLECSFSKPAKEKIAKLQAAGMPDQSIIDQFIQEYGKQIYRNEPNAFGWIIPYAAIVPGLILILWFVRRYRKPKPVPELEPVTLDERSLEKYNEQIERDLAHLD
jgi:cytochrome c-type biogenesis protein CcmH/NrfF